MSCDKAKKIIADLYESKELDHCINKNVHHKYRDDFRQELFLRLLQLPCDKITVDIKNIRYYTVKIILNLVHGKYDIYRKLYRDEKTVYDNDKVEYAMQSPADQDTIQDRILREQAEDELLSRVIGIDVELGNEGYPYHEKMVILMAQLGSQREIERQTGIPHVTVHRTLKRVREHLRK